MRAEVIEEAGLLCPVCRTTGLRAEGELWQGVLRCGQAGCGAVHPVIDGVPILVEDWVEYAQSERWMILRRRDLPAEVERLLDAPLGDDHAERIRGRHLESYRLGQGGEFSPEVAELGRAFPRFLEEVLQRQGGGRLGVDLGCATGGYTRMLAGYVECAVGLDLHFERVQEAAREAPANSAFVVANAERAPLTAGTVDVALALNLLDSTARPRALVAHVGRLLRAGGLVVLTTPFAYSSAYAAPEEWIGEEELAGVLAADFEVVEERARLPWVLPVNERRSDVFFVRAVVARRRA